MMEEGSFDYNSTDPPFKANGAAQTVYHVDVMTTTFTQSGGTEERAAAETATILIEDQPDGRTTEKITSSMRSRKDTLKSSTDAELDFEKSSILLAENSIEANRISNNYKVKHILLLVFLNSVKNLLFNNIVSLKTRYRN